MIQWYLQMKNIQFIVDFLADYKSLITPILLMMLSLAALYTDIKSFKIPNKLNLTFIIIGLLFNSLMGNFKYSIIGLLFPMILFPLFALRMIGAGDIKLFCAIGSIVTFPNIINVMVYSIVLNGVIAVILLIIRKEFKIFSKLFNWLKLCVFSHNIMPYQTLDNRSKTAFRYAYGILLGCVVYIIVTIFGGGKYVIF